MSRGLPTYVVTGGASGLGAGVVRLLAADPVHVVIAARSVAAGEALVASLEGKRHEEALLTVLPLDVASFESIKVRNTWGFGCSWFTFMKCFFF